MYCTSMDDWNCRSKLTTAKWLRTTLYPFLHVVGEVQNNSSSPMKYVEVTSKLYDSAGKVVGTGFGVIRH
jgi:hypothetical protein